ncbi:MAG: aconitase X swivel domain-containing protein [Promethearchaeota archaeon]
MRGRVIYPGVVRGDVLFSSAPLLIYGGIDVDSGVVVEEGHPLNGVSVKGKILVFPEAKGSTVGSYTILQLKAKGTAPVAIINERCEPIVATGVIMAKIPCIDKVQIEALKGAKEVSIIDGNIELIQ